MNYTSGFTSEKIDELLSSMNYSDVESNTDLNNIKSPGIYRIRSGTVFGTLSNKPTKAISAGSVLIAVNSIKDGDLMHILIQNYRTGMFFRALVSNSWYPWSRVVCEGENFNHKGTTALRPAFESNQYTVYIGFYYYDTDLSKPIWWNGDGWVDATGASV